MAWKTLFAFVLSSLIALGAAIAPAQARDLQADFRGVVERTTPAVVNVSTMVGGAMPAPGQQGQRARRSLGSGFIIDPSGLVVTNAHVVANATNVAVFTSDGLPFQARVVGADRFSDLAVLKIESDATFPFVRFGDSDEAAVGSIVLAVGNPFGLGGTVTTGIVSARDRLIPSSQYTDFIQTDAAINSGNSGGPLFNLQGEVIGVNTAIISPSGANAGIAFAIPGNLARSVAGQLARGEDVTRGWLGVDVQQITPQVAQTIGLPRGRSGVLVAGVAPNSPAARAGIRAGDVILRYRNTVLRSLRQLPTLVRATEINSQVEMRIWRAGQVIRLTVTIETLPVSPPRASMAPPETRNFAALDLRLTELSAPLVRHLGLSDTQTGLMIEGPLKHRLMPMGLQWGDVIMGVNDTEIERFEDITQALDAAPCEDGHACAVDLTILRGGADEPETMTVNLVR